MEILKKAERKEPPPVNKFDGIVGREIVSVKTKTDHILKKLKKGSKIGFKKSFSDVKSKSEAVSQFLAILELLRMGILEVIEEENDIYLRRTINDVTEDLEEDYR